MGSNISDVLLQWIGAVEQFIQTIKKGVRVAVTEDTTFHQKMMNFLLVYWTTPHTSIGVTPCVLFLKRDMKTHLVVLMI